METYVKCDDVSEGFRSSEVTVTVKSFKGRPEYLRVSERSLLAKNGDRYLAVGVVHIDRGTGHYLIEFPHEADSGANRIWIPGTNVLQDETCR